MDPAARRHALANGAEPGGEGKALTDATGTRGWMLGLPRSVLPDRLARPTSRRLLAVLVAFFGLYLLVGSVTHDFPDFVVQSKAAARIAAGELLYRDHVRYINVYHYPPVYLYALGGVYALVGVDYLAAKALLAACTVVSGALLFVVVETLLDERGAWLATLFYLANPVTVVGVYGGYFEAFVLVFVLGSLALVLADRPLLAGAVLALGVMSKPFPVLFAPLVAIVYLRSRPRGVVAFGAGFGAAVGAVSLPFLLAAPRAYVYYAFLYSFGRPASSLSLYYYFLPWLLDTPATLLLPGGIVVLVTAALARSRLALGDLLLGGGAVVLLGFLTLNRINYPHYLAFLVPLLGFVVAARYRDGATLAGVATWKLVAAPFGAMLVGAAVWAYPWLEGVVAFRSHPLFWVGATTYYLASAALLVVLGASLRAQGVRWSLREPPA